MRTTLPATADSPPHPGHAEPTPQRRHRPAWWHAVLWLVVVIVLLVIGWSISSAVFQPVERTSAGGMLFQARRLQAACLAFASIRGQLPAALPDLVPDFLPDARSLTDPEHPEAGDIGYYYYGSGRSALESPKDVLLASKAVVHGHRAVVLFGGHAALREFEPPAR